MSMQANKMASRDDAYVPRDPLSRERVVFHCVGESRTRQADATLHEVNAIVERFNRTGMLPPAKRQPQYADVTNLQADMTEHVNTVRKVRTALTSVEEKRKRRKAAEAQKSTAAKTAQEPQGDAPSDDPK